MELLRTYFLANRDEIIHIRPFNPFAFLLVLVPLVLLRRRGKGVGYLVCFALFFFYAWAVCAYAICPLPIEPDLISSMRRFDTWEHRLNLIPTFFNDNFYLDEENVRGNFLLGVPFGFAFPFLTGPKNRTALRAAGICLAYGAGLELIQLLISLVVYRFPYRSIDIDDVLLVFGGSLAGYAAFRLAAYLYRLLAWTGGARWPVWDHFHLVLAGPPPEPAPPEESTSLPPPRPPADPAPDGPAP